MAIIKVNNTSEESSVNFLVNQSSILYTLNTNKITVNGVNVIVNKPKVGDLMYVTSYTDENGDVLPADQQQVKWIDGLSIKTYMLSPEYKPVGICIAINGNKAMVLCCKYNYLRWSAADRWEMPKLLPIINEKSHSFRIKLNGTDHPNLFKYHYTNLSSTTEQESDFVDQLNDWFLANNRNYSAELVDKDTDLPVSQNSGYYRIIVNAIFTKNDWNTFSMVDVNDGTKITPTRAIGKQVEDVNWCYINNGFTRNFRGGCCRAKYYDYIQANQHAPTSAMENINYVPGGLDNGNLPVRLVDFNNNGRCKILRDNFATYDEYLESMLVKLPCGAGGVIAETPSGKENTYKLANCTFLNNNTGKQETLYPAASWAASIDINVPKLGKGNWWLPSVAEMAQMWRDITKNTNFWTTTPDIVNTVINKAVNHIQSPFDNSGYNNQWVSSSNMGYAWEYFSKHGELNNSGRVCNKNIVMSITIYEF